jgi:DNA-binding LacI/PurR family transcriptional regulator
MEHAITIKQKRTTLKDVSKHTGVSIMTVSNVVNGRDKYVSEKTRTLVKIAIKELNYRPHRSGRQLRNTHSLSIGFVIMNELPDFLSDPFISTLASGLCNHLSEQGYSLEVQGVNTETFHHANAFCNSGNDAICVILCGSKQNRQDKLKFLATLNLPIVILQEDCQTDDKNLAVVGQDDYKAGQLIANHVLQKKPKSILYVKPKTVWSAVEQREQGIRDTLSIAKHTSIISNLVTPSELFDDVIDIVKNRLSEDHVDCIIAATDTIAMAALKACQQSGLSVPSDITVAGFNGFESRQYSTPLLTTVVSPAYDIGETASKLMLEHIKQGYYSNRNIIYPVQLLIGEST